MNSIAEQIVEEVADKVKSLQEQRVKIAATHVLGIKLDSWGRVDGIDDSLIRALQEKEEVQVALAKFADKIAKILVDKPLTVRDQQEVVRLIRRKILNEMVENVYESIYEKVYESMYSIVEEEVISSLRKDKRIAPLLVGYELHKANSKNGQK